MHPMKNQITKISASQIASKTFTMKRLAVLSSSHRAISTVQSISTASIRQHNKTLSRLLLSGDIRRAQDLFNSISNPNTTTFNTMISYHAKNLQISSARQLFDKMPQRDVVSYNAMLLAYALSENHEYLEEGRKLFDKMPVRDSVSWNTMINGYVRNKRMGTAMDLFEVMPDGYKNVVSWNTVINGFFYVGDVTRALELFERMPVRDEATLCTVVDGMVKNGKLDEAEEILLRRGGEIDRTVDAYNTLIARYGQCGMVEEAMTLFYLIPKNSRRFKKNVISWNSMLMCYVKSGDVGLARALFDEMPERDLISWNTMINGYVQASEVDEAVRLFEILDNPDSWSLNAILCGLTEKGELDRARELFDRTRIKNIVSWNTMIAGYDTNGEYDVAIELFARMHAIGEQPDRHTLSSVLSACAGLATLRLGIQIHQLVRKRIMSETPIYNALITMYSRCGAVMHARAVFDEMSMHERDIVSWNSMIGGYAHHGHANEALDLFQAMKRVMVNPTYITFISILKACSHAGLVDEGNRLFNSMAQEFGITPRIEHYASLIDLHARHGMLEDAVKVIEEMVVPPDKVVWGALLSASRIHNNARMARKAAEELAKLEPGSSAPYVMLYNVHADEGRWADATEIREKLDRSGIVKQPAYSWIELENRIHRFISGDRSHPLSFEIFLLLKSFYTISREIYT